MPKTKRNPTSARVASTAGRILRDKLGRFTSASKSVAGSALSQRKGAKRRPK